MAVEEGEQRVDLGANLRVLVERVDGREREQNEGVVVGIAPRVQHSAVRRQPVHIAGPTVGRLRSASRCSSPFSAMARPSGYQPICAALA